MNSWKIALFFWCFTWLYYPHTVGYQLMTLKKTEKKQKYFPQMTHFHANKR